MAEVVYTMWGGAASGTIQPDTASYTFGNQFTVSQLCRLTGIWFFSPSGAGTLPTACGIYTAATPHSGEGGLLVQNTSPTWSGAAGSGWIKCTFDGGITLSPGQAYKTCVQSNGGTSFYATTFNYWSSGVGASGLTSGIITMPNDSGGDGGQSTFNSPSTGSVLTYPDTVYGGGENLWVDVEVTTGLPGPAAPVAGFALASPRSWNPLDQITTPRLRGDMYNLAALMTKGRPIIYATAQGRVSHSNLTFVSGNTPVLNTWNVSFTQDTGNNQYYPVPLPGWYLLQGWAGQTPHGGGSSTDQYDWGLSWNQGVSALTVRSDLGDCSSTSSGGINSASLGIGNSGTELVLLTPATGDLIGPYVFTTSGGGSNVNVKWGAEWVGLPSSGTINGTAYTGPVGTVVASPKPASLWPAGPGGTLASTVSAGGSILSLGPVAGLRAGGVIGLDWQDGLQSQAYSETATVASVAGGTVTTTTALLYGHSAGAPVSVPVSAAFLNEQMRDQVNFMFYPPMLRAVQGTAAVQSIPNNTWTTVNLTLSGATVTNTIDNFAGFTAGTISAYTIPVSGTYLVSGQVYFAGTSSSGNFSAAILDNLGNRWQGDLYHSAGASSATQAPSVRHLLRLTAGQTVALQANQTTGGSLNTNPVVATPTAGDQTETLPKLVVVWRSF